MNKHKYTLKDLSAFVPADTSIHKIARDAGISWPAVNKYLNGVPYPPKEPSIAHIAALLDGMGVNWERVMLGELLEKSGSD